MSRWKAASIHLSISAIVGLLVFALLFLVWYPQPLFEASGGQQLIVLLLGVDLVLGPLLTLILFKSGKKGMALDLGLIALIQGAALLYGTHVIAQARPAFIVAAIDRFSVVSANELDPADLAKGSAPEYRSMSWTGPRLVAARLPTDVDRLNALAFSGAEGKDIEKFPEFYVPYEQEAAALLKRAKSAESLRRSIPEAAPLLDAWLRDKGRSDSEIVWTPVNARRASLIMLLDATTGAVLGALPIDPW
ncbi:TfpX/TfpZ family type IV pilin accessory protein [Dokdonella sp.]|uniref:TfpX/TfpZ family type IV pilin accessory protein n=1 Tax=Dokdonella sp. TaxID=2291710 RepID=UPI003529CFD5